MTARSWQQVPELIRNAAARRRRQVDVGRVVRAFEGAIRAYHRRCKQSGALPAAKQRQRLGRLRDALRTLERELNSVYQEESLGGFPPEQSVIRDLRVAWPHLSGVAVEPTADSPVVYLVPREHPFALEDWLTALHRIQRHVETLAFAAERPTKRGERGDPALRRLLLDAALILGREDLPLTIRSGLFPACARAVVWKAAERRLPTEENIGEKLRPIVVAARRILGRR